MIQVVQYQKTGEIMVMDLPAPQLKPGGVVIRNLYSLISSGTEKSSVRTAQASMIGKARSRPDLVKQVMANVRREGVVATIQKVRTRLDTYKPLGYSSAGLIVESAVPEFSPGDRVACGGVGYAGHSEYVFVPKNLVVKIPDSIGLDEAAFTTVGSIALEGVRRSEAHIGETVVVVGLGLLGLLTIQILSAQGISVIGLDISSANFSIAKDLGCMSCLASNRKSVRGVENATSGLGADSVIITAASLSTEPVELAIEIARKRGKIVVVGSVPMNIPRSPFYEKELDLRMSCSYGPGRYDASYEEGGIDYPPAYVRWTEGRNMHAFARLVGDKRVDVKRLVTHTFPVQHALDAYDIITGKAKKPAIAVLLQFPESDNVARAPRPLVSIKPQHERPGEPAIGFIGAGNFAQSYLLPHLVKRGAELRTIVTGNAINANAVGKKYGFSQIGSDPMAVIADPSVTSVFIATRHDSHGGYVRDALRAGKQVFVEKPLAITREQLEEIRSAYTERSAGASYPPFLMVGYNRRFAKAVRVLKESLEGRTEPMMLTYRVNAGYLPSTNWYQGAAQGGRVIGEACHFIDTMQFLTGALPDEVFTAGITDTMNRYASDVVSMTLRFKDGSVGTILYAANGSPGMPKERIEVLGEGRSAIMDNFREVHLFGDRKEKRYRFDGTKGHDGEMSDVLEGLRRGVSPIAFDSLAATTEATFAAMDSLIQRMPVRIG